MNCVDQYKGNIEKKKGIKRKKLRVIETDILFYF